MEPPPQLRTKHQASPCPAERKKQAPFLIPFLGLYRQQPTTESVSLDFLKLASTDTSTANHEGCTIEASMRTHNYQPQQLS
jgi:hypothetical protein